jgi:hypothetical protein
MTIAARVATWAAAVALVHVVSAVPASAAGGDLDTRFDSDGQVVTAFPAEAGANALAIQRDGKIVVVGSAGDRFALA